MEPTTHRRPWGLLPRCWSPADYKRTFMCHRGLSPLPVSAIGLGTMSGGWRIVRTMGTRLTRLQSTQRFLRGDRRGDLDSFRDFAGAAGFQHSCHRRSHRGRGFHPADAGRALALGGWNCHCLGPDDPGRGSGFRRSIGLFGCSFPEPEPRESLDADTRPVVRRRTRHPRTPPAGFVLSSHPGLYCQF